MATVNQNEKIHVKLLLIKGAKKAFDENGQLLNDNQLVTLKYGIAEWNQRLSVFIKSGFGMIEVKQCFNEKEAEIDTPQEIIDSVNSHLFPTSNVPLTEDQKKIKELEAKLDAVLAKDAKPKGKNDKTAEGGDAKE